MVDKKPWNHLKAEPEIITEIDGTPTVAGLMKMGRDYAYMQGNGIRITHKGHALLTERQRAHAEGTKGQWHGVTGAHDGPVPQPGFE